jgi:uncharacterized membrane protein (UPF0182 family)
MPELRLVVLALQDRLAYGPTFDSAMRALFGREDSPLRAAATVVSAPSAATSPVSSKAAVDLNALVTGAAKDLAD